jgi:predicted RNase H-like HicB family nuclease
MSDAAIWLSWSAWALGARGETQSSTSRQRSSCGLADRIDIVEVDAFARSVLIYYVLMRLRLVVEHDSETKRWAAFFPELPGCASAGDTEEEAIRNAKEALELWFEPAPVDLPAGAKVLEVALT